MLGNPWLRRLIVAMVVAVLIGPPIALQDAAAVTLSPNQFTTNGKAGWVSIHYLHTHPTVARALGIDQNTAVRLDDSRLSAREDRVVGASSVARPASHSGCSQEVCINVQGHSTIVTAWTTKAYGGNGTCTKPYYQVFAHTHKTTLVHQWTGPIICAGAGEGWFYDDSNEHSGSYPDGYELCNVWAYIPGQPCAGIVA